MFCALVFVGRVSRSCATENTYMFVGPPSTNVTGVGPPQKLVSETAASHTCLIRVYLCGVDHIPPLNNSVPTARHELVPIPFRELLAAPSAFATDGQSERGSAIRSVLYKDVIKASRGFEPTKYTSS